MVSTLMMCIICYRLTKFISVKFCLSKIFEIISNLILVHVVKKEDKKYLQFLFVHCLFNVSQDKPIAFF